MIDRTPSSPPLPSRRSVVHRARRTPIAQAIAMVLLAGMSAGVQAQQAPTPLTRAWFDGRSGGQPTTQPGAPGAPGGLLSNSGGVTDPAGALRDPAIQRSIANLKTAAAAISAAQLQQKHAADAALNNPSAFNGLSEGGLKLAPGVADNALDPTVAVDGSLWQNAELPTQALDAGRNLVTIKQTDKKAILNWETFNVGSNTTVYYNQSAGNQAGGVNEWIALNRINDPSGRPSQILGRIKAEGSVYLLNRNGVMFGAGSQVSTHSLLVSSLNLFNDDLAESNRIFFEQGLTGDTFGTILTGTSAVKAGNRPGDIRIEAGADIATAPGGFSLIAAPNVYNAGSVRANDGQAILAATLSVSRLGSGPQSQSNNLPLVFDQIGTLAGQDIFDRGLAANGLGRLENTGLVISSRGDVTLSGDMIRQLGVVVATSGISRPGSVNIRAVDHTDSLSGETVPATTGGVLEIGRNALTALLPEYDGGTTTSSAAATAAFDPGTVTLVGAQIHFQQDSLVLAPGALITIKGLDAALRTINGQQVLRVGQRILIDTGAIISVAGLPDVQLPVTVNLVAIPRIGQNELADSPLQRDGDLFRKEIVIDSRVSGNRNDGSGYVGSPILNAGGYVEQVPRTIDQLLIDGGTIDISGRELILQPGATLSLDGGYLHYLGGMVETRRLLGADGRIYNLSDADPMADYLGFAGEYTVNHSRWGITETFSNPLIAKQRYYESDYLHGGDAGTLKLRIGAGFPAPDENGSFLPSNAAAILAGGISAKAFSGRYQVKFGEQAQGGSLDIGGRGGDATLNWVIRKDGPDALPNGFGIDSAFGELPGSGLDPGDVDNPRYWGVLSSDALNESGFSSIAIAGDLTGDGTNKMQILVQRDADLIVQPGGRIEFNGARVEVQGALTALSGTINITAGGQFAPIGTLAGDPLMDGGILVGGEARLNARGQWVNDFGLLTDEQHGGAFIDGGSISLNVMESIQPNGSGSYIDTSGSLVLESGAVLDVSGGGRILPNGQLASSKGVPLGRGGDIALRTYVHRFQDQGRPPSLAVRNPVANDNIGVLRFDGAQLIADSLGGGGTLTLRARNVQIGGDAPTDARDLYLAEDFFENGSFGAYDLAAELDATIAADSQVRISQRNLAPNQSALANAATGANIYAGLTDAVGASNDYGTLAVLDPYYRPSTDFSLRSGDYLGRASDDLTGPAIAETGTTLLDSGASLLLDAGADVRLGSRGQVTVLGSIIAPGGSIALSGDTSQNSLLSPVPGADNLPPVGGDRTKYGRADKSVWVGADSVLDVSGIALIDPFAKSARDVDGNVFVPRTGKVLDGGRIVLTDDGGYVVVEAGAQLRLQGASDRFDLPVDGSGNFAGSDVRTTPTDVWSNGGSLTLASSGGLFFDGSIFANGGDARALGGSLTLLPLVGPAGFTSTAIVFQQSGSQLSADARPGGLIEPERDAPSGRMYFAADRLDGSGIDTLVVGNQAPGARGNGMNDSPLVPIVFSGDVDLSVRRALFLNAPNYVMLPEGVYDPAAAGGSGTVTLSAGYVGFNGYRGLSRVGVAPVLAALPAPVGASSLSVDADFIDIGGQISLQNIAQANFTSRGDLRFYTPAQYAFLDPLTASATRERIPGELLTAGDLTFQAAQVYPATGEQFIVRAIGAVDADTGAQAATTIRFLPNGDSKTPLSAGGSLLVDATNIEQSGTLRAPAGRIVLGVGDPANAASQALYGGRGLVATQSVRLTDGSVTSVSLDGQIVPYGTTVDGLQWKFNENPRIAGGGNDVTAPPEKILQINGADIALEDGATVDLSGGGDLQAIEWIAGTGGSRDVLSQFNTSFSGADNGTQVPLYADERGVYAIIPGVQPVIAAADPVFGNGQAPIGVGQSVELRGVPGLPDGVYTLLPAKYATLPGAFRVVQRTGTQDSLASRNLVMRDGTAVVAGRFVDGLTGAVDARSTSFEVQSRDVWGQYSEYTATGADKFFTALAQKAGNATPRLARDGGQLVLGATDRLSLGATLDTSAGKDGAAALVDIASQAIQIVGDGQTALDGYVQLDVGDLGALAASSLLIGGTRRQTADGLLIDVAADSLIVSNDASDPLRSPELILVARAGDANDPNAGLHVAAGSVIEAVGALPSGGAATPIVIGVAADADGNGGVSGDGALLRVSNAGPAQILRRNVPTIDTATGLLDIGAGARLDGGASLTLDSTGDTRVAADAVLRGTAIDASAGQISFVDGDAAAGLGGFVVGAQSLAQLAAAQRVSLRSYGSIDFFGDVNVDLDQSLTLSAGTFRSDGGAVTLRADTLTLDNALGGTASADAGDAGVGRLTLQGDDIVFGAGNATLAGFGVVDADAGVAIHGRDSGRFDFGAVDVTLRAPLIQADAGADSTLVTTGALTLVRSARTVAAPTDLGGAIDLIGGSVVSDALIRANAGTINLQATSGDLRLVDGAYVDVTGVAKQFFDITAYAPGGRIGLTADDGLVQLAAAATLDFSASANGGDAGSLKVSAPTQTAELLGTLKGTAPKGRGGSFTLDVGGAVDLDALSGRLASSGINRAIDVRTRTGNLVLSAGNTLVAGNVTLTADGGSASQTRDADNGNVIVDGRIDASGTSGGDIALWGRHGVAVNGELLATGSRENRRGGNVTLGTSGRSDGTLNDAYGYQNVQAADAGLIAIGADARIDVSGGSAGGLSGGKIDIRAPLLANGDVNIDIADGAQIKGAREVALEAYAVWSTTDTIIDPSRHFDGLVDPAGWYNHETGELVPGTWTDSTGTVLPPPADADQLADYLDQYYFAPDAGMSDAAHQTFYGYVDGNAEQAAPGTLMGFIQAPGFAFEQRFANIANFRTRAGVELRNPDATRYDGAIRVLTNWNLGSGASVDNLDYRTNGIAPVLTLRAAGDVQINASISDGFYNFNVGGGGGGGVIGSDYQTALQRYDEIKAGWTASVGGDTPPLSDFLPMPEFFASGENDQTAQYYGQYLALADILIRPRNGDFIGSGGILFDFLLFYAFGIPTQTFADQPVAPAAPTNPVNYQTYLPVYEQYGLDMASYYFGVLGGGEILPTLEALPQLPILGPLIEREAGADRSPSLQASAANPIPFAVSTLAGGDSSSYRFVAGADFDSVAPTSVRTDAASGDIVLDGHTTYRSDGQRDLVLPTVVRTGTGEITFVAAQDLRFADTLSPASVYTAGRPGEGTTAGTDVEVKTFAAEFPDDNAGSTPGLVVTGQVNPEAAGDIELLAGRDILGNRQIYDVDGSITGVAGSYIGQYWWPWMQTGNTVANGQLVASSINFGGFAQGVLSVGGNVDVRAGRDIRELSVSLPTSWTLTADDQGQRSLAIHGGGNLAVDAGRDVLGGDYFVGKGEGSLIAGGSIGSAFDLQASVFLGNDVGQRTFSSAVAPVLALQDAVWEVQAAQDAQIGAVVNPSYVTPNSDQLALPFDLLDAENGKVTDSQIYGTDSAVNLVAVGGDVRFGTQQLPGALFTYGDTSGGNFGRRQQNLNVRVFTNTLPASLDLRALSGDLSIEDGGELVPSSKGNLTLLADGDIRLFSTQEPRDLTLRLLDIDPATSLPSPFDPLRNTRWDARSFDGNRVRTGQANLHRDDPDPVRIYALTGDILGGATGGGQDAVNLQLVIPKPAQIRAGHDIVDLDFRGQNYLSSDVTSIVSGRDLYYTPLAKGANGIQWYWLELGGPGLFEVQAGRNLGPITSANEFNNKASAGGVFPSNAGGLRSIGNRDNAGLPFEGADIVARFGVSPGIATGEFAQIYLDPASADAANYRDLLIDFAQQLERDRRARAGEDGDVLLTAEQAWLSFQQQPQTVQQSLVDQVFLDVLQRVGKDYNDPDSPNFNQYSNGYRAINTLFPAERGYTANNLEGGENGAAEQVATGNLDMRGSTLQTEQGGDIRLLGPGGSVLVGSLSAPPVVRGRDGSVIIGPNQQGILTLNDGGIGIFTDLDVQLAQSRIFTQRGGDLLIWSSNGDINAGKGAKTSSDTPPVGYTCTLDFYCRVDAKGQVSGAGIATLQTVPGAPTGDAVLVAPRGTVDAGDAGIRVSGNLVVAAQSVANADNIEVQGEKIGVPTVASVNVGALTAASSAATAASQAAQDIARRQQDDARNQAGSVISVDVTGFGGG